VIARRGAGNFTNGERCRCGETLPDAPVRGRIDQVADTGRAIVGQRIVRVYHGKPRIQIEPRRETTGRGFIDQQTRHINRPT
jgi:hypothetical protein